MLDLKQICWPVTQLGEALAALSRRSDLHPTSGETPTLPVSVLDGGTEAIEDWLQSACRTVGTEAEPIETSYSDVRSFLRACGPALIRLDLDGNLSLLAIISGSRGYLRVLSPELSTHRIPARAIEAALCRPLELPLLAEVDRVIEQAEITGRRRHSVRACILAERLRTAPVQAGWLLRVPVSGGVWRHVRGANLLPRLGMFITLHLADSLLVLMAWWLIGRAALQGHVDEGLFIAWVLTLFTRMPLGLWATWTQGRLVIDVAALLKRVLLTGSLRLNPDEVRHEGVGQLLGRVIESEALESLALASGLTGIIAVSELVIAAAVLAFGADKPWIAALLFGWTAVLCVLSWRYFRHRLAWTDRRLEITDDLVESMTGHRTRLVQQPREQWYQRDDGVLNDYVDTCREMDRTALLLTALIPRGWMIVSLAALLPDFVWRGATPTGLAVAFGGILLAQGALTSVTAALAYVSSAVIAWKKVKPLFDAAGREEPPGSPEFSLTIRDDNELRSDRQVLIDVQDLVFRHSGRADHALDGCHMRIYQRDRILLEGASGSGKSTFAALLGGLRHPHSGLITFRGLDRCTIGADTWRRLVAAVPQFHENHLFSGTLAFNLLMGRHWPAQPEDYEEAESVCRELGLGDLLDRMPAGLMQIVGEAGWQLSTGERCRIFLARALLQRAEFIILDESLGTLDPETMQIAVDCIHRRAQSLLVIAHP